MSQSCKYCGNPIDADDLFCTGCGRKIEENFNAYTQKTQAPPKESAPEQAAPEQSTTEQAASQQNTTEQAPPPRQAYTIPQNSVNEPLSLGKCILGFLLLLIPFVNIICLFVWAFSSTSNTNAKNIARTLLIAGVLSIVLFIAGTIQFFFQFDTITNFPSDIIEEESPIMPWDRLELPFDVSEL